MKYKSGCFNVARMIAEEALGKPLPRKAEVHHVDGIRGNDYNDNLVVCEDRAYHFLLHVRTRSLKATGKVNLLHCGDCGEWKETKDMNGRRGGRCKLCDARQHREARMEHKRYATIK